MMQPELHYLGSDAFIWHHYDASVKTELFSTALTNRAGTSLIDPIPIAMDTLASALGEGRVASVFVTNSNHSRAAAVFSAKFAVPIFAHAAARDELGDLNLNEVADGETHLGLRIIELSGAAPGEIALYSPDATGTVVIGDAVINFGSNGFALLPPKYCENAKLLPKSLRKLLSLEFDRMLFAHGTPILSGARAKLAELLDASR
ncbi:MAG: MBL fold metallo-hydrolase [Chthoniobacterales bacterium]